MIKFMKMQVEHHKEFAIQIAVSKEAIDDRVDSFTTRHLVNESMKNSPLITSEQAQFNGISKGKDGKTIQSRNLFAHDTHNRMM